MKNNNLNRLFYFHVFVKKQNMVLAANELCITQPALSAQLKQLEIDFAVPIFERKNRNLELTPQGEHLFYFTKKIFDTYETMIKEINPLEGKPVSLRIGISDQIERSHCVHFISEIFHSKNPVDATKFYAESITNEFLTERLLNSEIDLVLSSEPFDGEGIVTLSRVEIPVVLAVPKSYHGNRTPFTIEQYVDTLISKDIAMVMPQHSIKFRKKIDSFLEGRNITPNIIFESNIMAVLVRAISDGIGCGFMPVTYIRNELQSNKVKVAGLPNGFWTESLWLLANTNSPLQSSFPEFKLIFDHCFHNLATW